MDKVTQPEMYPIACLENSQLFGDCAHEKFKNSNQDYNFFLDDQ